MQTCVCRVRNPDFIAVRHGAKPLDTEPLSPLHSAGQALIEDVLTDEDDSSNDDVWSTTDNEV